MSHHRALQLHEVLTLIFEHIHPGGKDEDSLRVVDRFDNYSALARSAQVCKTFSEPALQVLWTSIPTFAILVRLLSCCHRTELEILNDNGFWARPPRYAYVLRGRIQPAEWARFQYYTRFVRRCREDPDTAVIDPSVYAYLFRYNDAKPLFAGLQHVHFSQEHANDTSLLAFLTPSLHHLTFQILTIEDQKHGIDPLVTDYALETLLSEVVSTATSLEELTLVGVRHWQSVAPLVNCQELQHLSLYDTSPIGKSMRDVLSILTHIPRLRSLEIQCNRAMCSQDHRGGRLCFPHLTKLVAGGFEDSVGLLFANTTLPRLQTLRLALEFREQESIIGRFIRDSNLADIAPELRSLCFTTRSWSPTATPEGAISLLDLFKPLLALKQIHEFMFSPRLIRPHFSDDDACQITEAWPKLRKFWLEIAPSSVRPSLHTLLLFAQNCPDLEKLSIPSIRHIGDLPETTALHSHRLVTLDVYIHGVDRERLNHFLSSLFPLARKVMQERDLSTLTMALLNGEEIPE
ncbi:uncharacterized protein B0H18DRAFT_1119868 [Fomitopsis serialis]|uniref:uncharacterized protein n=1 Tax=Fomitopsis serialis TaxID=139415 RepID=UPI0020086497|nr:uncharacterized protein B0H18DRAFT_1119868 [Neoantrodia serialis]KAH9924531.1 hypothetical protein B0H18DRAFT_1119868 [Neoantrodia serialis]